MSRVFIKIGQKSMNKINMEDVSHIDMTRNNQEKWKELDYYSENLKKSQLYNQDPSSNETKTAEKLKKNDFLPFSNDKDFITTFAHQYGEDHNNKKTIQRPSLSSRLRFEDAYRKENPMEYAKPNLTEDGTKTLYKLFKITNYIFVMKIL